MRVVRFFGKSHTTLCITTPFMKPCIIKIEHTSAPIIRHTCFAVSLLTDSTSAADIPVTNERPVIC